MINNYGVGRQAVTMAKMFSEYPKTRNALPEAYQRIYLEHYENNRNASTPLTRISSILESWMHRQVASSYIAGCRTLEIGGGTLNHVPYEPTSSEAYDVVEPFHELYEKSQYKSQVRDFYDDVNEVPAACIYDRIISIATFEHICNLPEAVAQMVEHMTEETGILAVGIPSEGCFLWKLGYTLSTGVEFYLRYHLDYSILMNYEHINSAKEIENILNYFFGHVKKKMFGLCNSLSLYQYYECRDPLILKARQYLNT